MKEHIVKYVVTVSLSLLCLGCSVSTKGPVDYQNSNYVELEGKYTKITNNHDTIVVYLESEFTVSSKYVSALGENCMILISSAKASSITVCETPKGWYQVNNKSDVSGK